MSSIIKSVSLNLLDIDFCKEFELSLSGLLKQRIQQVREIQRSSIVEKLQKQNNILQEKLFEANEKIVKQND